VIDMPPMPPPISAEAIPQKLTECGLDARGITIDYADDLQGYVIKITPQAGATAKNVQCIWDATWSEFVEFADTELQAAYSEITRARFEPIAMQSARESLEKKGLLANLPSRQDFASLSDFAEAIEKHCGLNPHDILSVDGDHVTMQPKFPADSRDYDKVGCIFSALTVSGVTKIGIIGNERFADDPK